MTEPTRDRVYRVATFVDRDRPLCLSRIMTYTLWYSPEWEGCIVYEIRALSGKIAKRKAAEMRLAEEKLKRG